MTLKCSVFGHRYGDAEITREREERGSEVVTTITETETCQRCGETQVVSENTEVTTLETPADIVEDTAEGADADADDGGAAPTPDEPAASDRLIDEAESQDVAPASPVGASAETGAGGVGGPDPEGEDDAVILDEGPDTDDEDDGQQRAPGEWPDEDEDEEADDEWIPDTTNVTETGTEGLPSIESEQPAFERTGQAASVPEGEFHCPECGFRTAVESSSLREGDFCPECHRGVLEHYLEG